MNGISGSTETFPDFRIEFTSTNSTQQRVKQVFYSAAERYLFLSLCLSLKVRSSATICGNLCHSFIRCFILVLYYTIVFFAETRLAKWYRHDVNLHEVCKNRNWVTAGSFPG